MTTVVVYHRTVPNAKNLEKIDALKNYSLGIKAVGDPVIDSQDFTYQNANVAVIQGWVHKGSKTGLHLKLRNEVVHNQMSKKKFVVVIDSNMFLYADTSNYLHYLRYSFNGIFPNTGIYCDDRIDPNRWKKLSQNLNLCIKDYRKSGSHILLCLQRHGGWSMNGLNVQTWLNKVIDNLRFYTDRPIIVRPHPGDKNTLQDVKINPNHYTISNEKNVILSTNIKLNDDLKNCWAVVNHNSSSVVGAALEGIPIFLTDPEHSQCKEIANIDLAQIENPKMFDRQMWAERLSMFHWNFDELKSGECWSHMKQYVL